MKRNMDLIRTMLLDVEKNAIGTLAGVTLEYPNVDQNEVVYNVRLLFDAGYIDGGFAEFLGGGADYHINRITMSGHEFLDTIRDNKIWSKTKHAVKTTGSMGLDLVMGVARSYIKQEIKIKLGFDV